MGNVAATFRSACARLKAASTAIRLSSYFTDTTLGAEVQVSDRPDGVETSTAELWGRGLPRPYRFDTFISLSRGSGEGLTLQEVAWAIGKKGPKRGTKPLCDLESVSRSLGSLTAAPVWSSRYLWCSVFDDFENITNEPSMLLKIKDRSFWNPAYY